MPLAQAHHCGLVAVGAELPRAVEVLGLNELRTGRIQCIQNVEFVLTAEIGHQRAAFGRRQGAVVDHHLGNLAIVTVLRLVELLSSQAIAPAALIACRGLRRNLTIHAQDIAQAILDLHGRTFAGRTNHDDGEAAVSDNLQRIIHIDFVVWGGRQPAKATLRRVRLVVMLEGKCFPPAAGVPGAEDHLALLTAALELQDEQGGRVRMFVERILGPRQHPSTTEGDRRPVACRGLVHHVRRRLLGPYREIEMPGRLIAPGDHRSAEVRVRGAVLGGIANSGVGAQPEAQVWAVGVGLAAG